MKCQICGKTISDFEYNSLNGECDDCQKLSEQQWYDFQFENIEEVQNEQEKH